MVLLDSVSHRFGWCRISRQRLEDAVHCDWGSVNSDGSWLVVSYTKILSMFSLSSLKLGTNIKY